MNISNLAKEISKIEGGKVNLPIAQIKEVLRVYGDIYYGLEESDQKALDKAMKDAAAKRSKGKSLKKSKGKAKNKRPTKEFLKTIKVLQSF